MAIPRPLPIKTVERIFAKLHLRYGRAWAQKWDGFDTPADPNDPASPTLMAAVHAEWAEELAGVSDDQIRHAFSTLPPNAPSAPAFRALCHEMPSPVTVLKALPPKDVDQAGLARVVRELRSLAGEMRESRDVRAETERRLLALEAQGRRLSSHQRSFLGQKAVEPDDVGEPLVMPERIPLPRGSNGRLDS
jgi:hypothetical protein